MFNSYLYPLKLNFNNYLNLLADIDGSKADFWHYLNVSYSCKLIDDKVDFILRNPRKLKAVQVKTKRPRRPLNLDTTKTL